MMKLGISAGMGMSIPVEEQLPIIKEAGFDSFFTGWSKGRPIQRYAEIAAASGLIYETLHAPFSNLNCIWKDGIDGDAYTQMFIDCVDDCALSDIKIMVTHVTVASVAPPPSEIGAYRFGKVISHAANKGVSIAFENLEIPEHLAFLFDKFKDAENVGFCYDCGHNLCYTPKINMAELYGDRLICVHLHDNFGMKNPEVVTWLDDLHYLPFDGLVDFNRVGEVMKKFGKDIPLTLELNQNKKPEYAQMTPREFILEAAERARKIEKLCH